MRIELRSLTRAYALGLSSNGNHNECILPPIDRRAIAGKAILMLSGACQTTRSRCRRRRGRRQSRTFSGRRARVWRAHAIRASGRELSGSARSVGLHLIIVASWVVSAIRLGARQANANRVSTRRTGLLVCQGAREASDTSATIELGACARTAPQHANE